MAFSKYLLDAQQLYWQKRGKRKERGEVEKEGRNKEKEREKGRNTEENQMTGLSNNLVHEFRL